MVVHPDWRWQRDQSLLSLLQASSELEGVNQFDRQVCIDNLDFSQAFRPVAALFSGVKGRLDLMIRVKEVSSGRSALNIYGIAKRVGRNPNNKHVAVHVAILHAELHRRRAARQSKPAPAPVPPASKGGAATI